LLGQSNEPTNERTRTKREWWFEICFWFHQFEFVRVVIIVKSSIIFLVVVVVVVMVGFFALLKFSRKKN